MGQMNEVVELDERRDEVSGGRYPARSRVGKSDGGGGNGMDDVLKRLGAVESTVSDIRSHVSAIAAVQPHLATKADVAELGTKIIKWIIATGMAMTGLIITAVKFVH